MATDNPKAMTPTAAVARHLEWLEFALAAARDEEVRRQGRVERATDKNRQKRSVRLAEVTAEVRELAALVTGLKDLQAKPTGPAKRSRSAAAAGRSRASATAKPKAATATKPKAAPAAKPKTAPAAKAKAPSTTRAKAPASRRAASKPSGASAKAPTTRRRPRARSTRRSPPSA